MKKVFLSFVFIVLSIYIHAQNVEGFNVDFRYATTKEGCSEVNMVFSYYPHDESFLINSEEAATPSRYKVLKYKKGKNEDKVFLDGGGLIVLKRGKGGFIKVIYEWDFNVVEYTDYKQEALKKDSLILKNK